MLPSAIKPARLCTLTGVLYNNTVCPDVPHSENDRNYKFIAVERTHLTVTLCIVFGAAAAMMGSSCHVSRILAKAT